MMRLSNSRLRRFSMVLGAATALGFGLTSGPNLPEYSSLESVEATDLVNLSSGSFAWSLPLMTVPGPGLGFPIVLSYHANSNQKDEASWVGFGWNIQAGAITRQVNNIPDDFKNIVIQEAVSSDKIHGWAHSISYNGVTVGISHRSDQGYGGIVGYNLLQEVEGPFSLNATVGLGSAKGQTGLSAGVSAGKWIAKGKDVGLGSGAGLSIGISDDEGASISAGVGISLAENPNNPAKSTSASLGSMGVSLSQKGGLSSGISTVGGSHGTTVRGHVNSSSSSFFLPLYVPNVGLFTYSHSSWTAWISGLQNDRYYGFLYADSLGMECTGAAGSRNCHQTASVEQKKRHEFMGAALPLTKELDARLMKGAEDAYLVTAQGISGAFKPYRKEDGDYLNTLDNTSKFVCSWDFWNGCDRQRVNRTSELEKNENLLNLNLKSSDLKGSGDVYWRYLDDNGGGEYTDPTTRDQTATVGARSRRVTPVTDATGRLTGFTVQNTSGVTYNFTFPLLNVKEVKIGYQAGSGLENRTTSQSIDNYAYAWLLTSILSPDYVDVNGNGRSDDGDIGGWVQMNYGDGSGPAGIGKKPVQNWRTPYADWSGGALDNNLIYSPSPQTNGSTVSDGLQIASSRNRAYGLKEIAYLQSIETPTHRAEFTTKAETREDNWPAHQAWIREIGPNVDDDFVYDFSTPNGSPKTLQMTFRLHEGGYIFPGIEDTRLNTGDRVALTVVAAAYYKWGQSDGVSCLYQNEPQPDYVQYEIPDYIVGQQVTVTGNLNIPTWANCGAESYGGGQSQLSSVAQVYAASKKDSDNRSKVLQSISLREKSTNTEISFAEFQTDYSLSPNTPNSKRADNGASTHGKLTLKSVRLGASQSGPFMPPYEMQYTNNPAFQSGNWVPYEKPEWDRWGNRCHNCTDTYHEPSMPFKDGKFDGGAWNLDRIQTPSGALITVKYGPKKYEFIGEVPVGRNINATETEIVLSSGGPDMIRERGGNSGSDWELLLAQVKMENIRKKLLDRGMTVKRYRLVAKIYENSISDIAVSNSKTQVVPGPGYQTAPFHRNWISHCSQTGISCGEPYGGILSLDQEMDASPFPGPDIWIGMSLRGKNTGKAVADYTLYAIVNTTPASLQEYASGSVVTELSYREPFSNNVYTTRYAYEGGVTPTLPATFSDYNDSRHLQGRGLEFFLGNPGVYYSKVTTTVNGKHKSEYQFVTPRNAPAYVGPAVQAAAPSPSGSQLSRVIVSDFSSLWGSLYRKDDFADGQTTPIRILKSVWAYNRKQLPTDGRTFFDSKLGGLSILEDLQEESASANYYVSNATATQSSHFGHHQTVASMRFFNSAGCYVGDDCQSNTRTTQVVHKRFLPMIAREIKSQEGLETEEFSYYPDFQSGRPLKRRTVNSDGSALVTSTIPAYYKYQPMEKKNALDQNYSVATYLYGSGERTGKAFNTFEASNRAISSELTLWRPFNREGNLQEGDPINIQAFRKERTLRWHADLNATTRPSLSIPADFCNIVASSGHVTCNASVDGSLGSWFLDEQVNRYDAMGHVVEFMGQKGRNHSVIYGHRNSLPTAFVENTFMPIPGVSRRFQAFYEGFEFHEDVSKRLPGIPSSQYSTTSGHFKSGNKSLRVNNSSSVGSSMVCFSLGFLKPHEEYEASVWYYDATTGISNDDGDATRPGIFLGKDAGCASENHPNGSMEGPVPGPEAPNYPEQATGSKKWIRLSTRISEGQCPDGGELDPAIVCLYASKGNSGRHVLYDELRVRSGASRMTTFAYDIRGNMISTTDEREVVTRFEYDPLGNLTAIRNDDGVLVSEQAKKAGNR